MTQELIERLIDEANLLQAEGAEQSAALIDTAIEKIKQQAAQIEQQAAELERERLRLAACGVVATADTPESAATARDMHPDYKSASCDDVSRRVDECMELRERVQQQAAEIKRLQADAENFHMDYRMKCDVETKQQAAKIERLRAVLSTLAALQAETMRTEWGASAEASSDLQKRWARAWSDARAALAEGKET